MLFRMIIRYTFSVDKLSILVTGLIKLAHKFLKKYGEHEIFKTGIFEGES